MGYSSGISAWVVCFLNRWFISENSFQDRHQKVAGAVRGTHLLV